MLIVWLAIVTVISVVALTFSLVAWSRLPRQTPPAYPPQFPSQPAPYNPYGAYSPLPGPTGPPPPAWEPRSGCTGAVID
ncbi:MAG: hypothetical protein JO236_02110 [Mycobacterium sp.]|uniref:hypothetical protein n=1 Tax=Mycobacterium sp. TaxID=1785 RepID=UPI001ECCE828|nr:hypothetical protein [Mycobacterium sp.]MBW0016333.1 hypothetical protein [Mycobacterium sp.]